MTEAMLMTIKDVQEATQLGRTKIYELLRDGDLPFLKVGRSVRIRHEDFEVWLDKLERQTKAEYGFA